MTLKSHASATINEGNPRTTASGNGDSVSLNDLTPPLVGATLIAIGLKRQSLGGVLMALAGGGMVYKGLTGNSAIARQLGLEGHPNGKQNNGGPGPKTSQLRGIVTIGRPAKELYELWRQPETMQQIMAPIATVTEVSENHAQWEMNTPLLKTYSWETQVTDDSPGERIRWESTEGSDIPNQGEVIFRTAPNDLGTEVALEFSFEPPGGVVGEKALKLAEALPMVGDLAPGFLAFKPLRRFKSLAETGTISTTEGQSSGRSNESSDLAAWVTMRR